MAKGRRWGQSPPGLPPTLRRMPVCRSATPRQRGDRPPAPMQYEARLVVTQKARTDRAPLNQAPHGGLPYLAVARDLCRHGGLLVFGSIDLSPRAALPPHPPHHPGGRGCTKMPIFQHFHRLPDDPRPHHPLHARRARRRPRGPCHRDRHHALALRCADRHRRIQPGADPSVRRQTGQPPDRAYV